MRPVLKAAAFVAAAALVFFLPRLVSDFWAFRLANVGIYVIALLGLNLLTGFSGQISLGHGAFVALGGYASAILVAHHGVDPLISIPLAGLVAAAGGYLFGVPALRLSGLYLALVTFGVAVSFPQLAKKAADWHPFGVDLSTGGSTGLILNPLEPHFDQTPNDWLYYLSWVAAGILFLVAWALAAGRTGRALRAIRDSETAAAAVGVSLAGHKTFAFAVSAFYAGVAGALLALSVAYVSPNTFPITLSVLLLVGVVVGGLGSLPGTIVGAAFLFFLPIYSPTILHGAEWLLHFDANNQAPGVSTVIYGTVLVVVLLVLPGGAAQLLRLPGRLRSLTTGLYPASNSRAGVSDGGER